MSSVFRKNLGFVVPIKRENMAETIFYHNHAMTVVLVFAVVMIISTEEGAPRRPMSVF